MPERDLNIQRYNERAKYYLELSHTQLRMANFALVEKTEEYWKRKAYLTAMNATTCFRIARSIRHAGN